MVSQTLDVLTHNIAVARDYYAAIGENMHDAITLSAKRYCVAGVLIASTSALLVTETALEISGAGEYINPVMRTVLDACIAGYFAVKGGIYGFKNGQALAEDSILRIVTDFQTQNGHKPSL